MPRPNPTEVQSAFTALPTDSYEFVVESATLKRVTNKENSDKWFNQIAYRLRVTDGAQKDKLATFNYSIETNGYPNWDSASALRMGKPFLLACAGHKNDKDGETTYNAAHANGEGWDYDVDSQTLGAYWMEPIGKRVKADVKLVVSDGGMENNNFNKWRSV